MRDIDHTARQDRAIEHPSSDALERGVFVTSLVKALVHTEYSIAGAVESRSSTGFVVGLTGEWGLGKSSVLNLVARELQGLDHVAVATLNPWLFKGRDELVEAYFNVLRDALGTSPSEKAGALVRQLERYKASIEYVGVTTARLIDLVAGGGGASGFFSKWFLKLINSIAKPRELSARQERESLEAKLASEKFAVVVLIDELDRVEDEEVRAVAQLIKAVGDIKGISYLVAYDPERVAQALGRGSSYLERRSSGESYLEKIIQFPIPLRRLFEDDSRDLLKRAMQSNGVVIPEIFSAYQSEIFNQLIITLRTPREIKRLVGAYSVLEEIVRGEICCFDLLAYSWIVTKAPGVRQIISDKIQCFVSDPSAEEQIRRQRWRREHGDTHETLVDLLGPCPESYIDMLRLVFPRFSDAPESSAGASPGDRISKRRNLTRLLYLGNPPTQLSRAQVERIWAIVDQEELVAELRSLQRANLFESLLDRVADLSHMLPENGDQVFWGALSKVLARDHDWIVNEEVERGYVDDTGSMLWRLAHSGRGGISRFKNIMESLIESGDLLISPLLLRRHLFAYGLTPHEHQNSDPIYDLNETIALRDRELPRYRVAIMDGIALRRLPDTEAMYCIINSELWDEELKSNFTDQLISPDAIYSLAALMVPPGLMCGRDTLDIMFDADVVSERVSQLIDWSQIADNEWLAVCIRRLNGALTSGRFRE
ncbi:KAP family NTPase [Pseudomonas sp. Larv2_ips]|uniref:KAP family NTPase n=1 Tax=Pseudomonas sp. Larv2_ips TaxID=1896942 RepID=UPI001300B41E|nr:KAP family NTPase [Pseudomonas sp. Larv2_ips]